LRRIKSGSRLETLYSCKKLTTKIRPFYAKNTVFHGWACRTAYGTNSVSVKLVSQQCSLDHMKRRIE
jgi:hypothetical protein